MLSFQLLVQLLCVGMFALLEVPASGMLRVNLKVTASQVLNSGL
jgi:hypothetical protein